MPQSLKLNTSIEQIGQRHRVLVLGVVRLEPEGQFFRFAEWVQRGIPSYLSYLKNYSEIRRDPSKLLPGARSAIICAVQYQLARSANRPRIAGYADAPDYHRLLKRRLSAMSGDLRMSCQEFHTAQFRVVVDSAPILERALAARTSKGFLGKNTCYIHPRFGSSLLLGELITDVQLEPDAGAQVSPLVRTPEGGCGTCRRCQVHCPTGALSLDYQIDAEKCLSYWTIENRGPIPVEYWRYLEKFWYGCDICQNVCPYNRPKTGTDFATLESRGLQNLDLAEVAKMNQDFYEKTFGGSPMTRAKSDGLRRNALIAMVVTNHARLAEVLCLLAETEPAGLMRETMNQIPSFLAMAKEDV